MATTYLEELLGENERVVLETHQHWFVLFNKIFLEIALIVVIIGATLFAYTALASSLALAGFVLVLVPLIGMLRDIACCRIDRLQRLDRQRDQFHAIFLLNQRRVLGQVIQNAGGGQLMNVSPLGIFLDHSLQQDLRFIGHARDGFTVPTSRTDQRLDVIDGGRN